MSRPFARPWRRFLIGALVAASTLAFAADRAALPAAPCDRAPVRPAAAATNDLEEDPSAWGIYCEGAPTAAVDAVSAPDAVGTALDLSLTGGSAYSNAHFYRTLIAQPEARRFALSLRFLLPSTTHNNEGAPSVVQALEFGIDTWHSERRYEWAMQWRNVGDRTAPEWRYWDPSRPAGEGWVATGVAARLAPGQWHSLTLEGAIVGGYVRYERFSIDQRCHALDSATPPVVTPGEPDRLAVTVQLDGNAFQSPYRVLVDDVSLARSSDDRSEPCGRLQGTAIDRMELTRDWRAIRGSSAGTASLSSVEGCQGRAIRLDYDLGAVPGAWAQMRRDFDPPLDLSRVDHLRFRYRGTTVNMLEVGLIAADGRIFFATPRRRATAVSWCSDATWDLRGFRNSGEPFPDFSRVAAIFISVSNNDGGSGSSGALLVDDLEGVEIRSRTRTSCPARPNASPAALQRAAAWIAARQTSSGAVKSWLEEPVDFAWLYDQGLALLVLLDAYPDRAARLAAYLRSVQNRDGSWYAGYRYLTGAPINDEQPVGAISWAIYGLARYALASGDRAAFDTARAGAGWLARLQRSNGSLPALATAVTHAPAPTEANLDAWWAFRVTGYQAEADRLLDFILGRLWDSRARRFKSDADDHQVFLDNQTWGAALLGAIGRHDDARRALNYARWTLHVSTETPAGPICGFDGAGPFAVWNEGTAQYVAQQGEDSQFYWDQLARQQADDGGMPGSPLAREFSGYIVWLTPWHGVAPTAWFYFAGTGGPPGWPTF